MNNTSEVEDIPLLKMINFFFKEIKFRCTKNWNDSEIWGKYHN